MKMASSSRQKMSTPAPRLEASATWSRQVVAPTVITEGRPAFTKMARVARQAAVGDVICVSGELGASEMGRRLLAGEVKESLPAATRAQCRRRNTFRIK